MPIPTEDQALLRGEDQTIIPALNYFPAQVVATAVVTETPLEYPIGWVSVAWTTGVFSTLKIGSLYIIRSGDEIVTRGVLRTAPSANFMYIDGKSRGDAGQAVTQEFAITSGQTITVYSYQPLWALLSRIKDGIFYKKFDIPYDGSGSNPSPVVNIGQWRQVWANPKTGRGTLTFDNNNTFTWLGKNVASYLWTVPGTAVYLSGSNISAGITITLPEGFHIVRCRVTDTGGAVQEGWRPVWVNGDNFPPLNELYHVEIGGDDQDRKGRNMNFRIFGELPSDFLPGTALHFQERAYFNGEQLSEGVLVDNAPLFTKDRALKYDMIGGNKSIGLEAPGPWNWLSVIPMVSQAIVETDNPVAWTDIARTLGTPDFIGWYLLKHHSTYLDMFDYDPLRELNSEGQADPVRKLNWGLNGNTMAEYLAQCATVLGGNIGCVSEGDLLIRRDPNIEIQSFRSALDVRMTLEVNEETGISDITEPIEYPQAFFNSVGQIRLFALMYDGEQTTAFGSIAPGYLQMQASGGSDEDSFIVKPPDGLSSGDVGWRPGGQDAVNFISGHLLARQNNPTPDIRLTLNRNMDVVDPARMVWFRLRVPETWTPDGKAVNTRVLPVSVNRAWENQDGRGWTKKITVSVTPETFGQPGETYKMDKGSADLYEPEIPPVVDSEKEELLGTFPFVTAINTEGNIGITFNGANWEDLRFNMTGRAHDIAFDFDSEYITSGYTEGKLGAWVITSNPNGILIDYNASIWYAEDVLAQTIVWTKQFENSYSSSVRGSLRIVSSKDFAGLAAAVVHDSSGAYMIGTTDYGLNWTEYEAGNINGAAGEVGREIDIALNGETVITSGYHTASGTWRLVRFITPGAPSEFIAGSPSGDVPWPLIESDPESDFVYATKINTTVHTSPASYTFTVDGVDATGDGDPTDIVVINQGTPSPPSVYGGSPPVCGTGFTEGFTFGVAGTGGTSSTTTFKIKGIATFDDAEFFGSWIQHDPPCCCGVIGLVTTIGTITLVFRGGATSTFTITCTSNDSDGWHIQWNFLECTGSAGVIVDATKLVKIIYRFENQGKDPFYPPHMLNTVKLDVDHADIETPAFYVVTNIIGDSPVFESITPESGLFPRHPYSLSVDQFAPDQLRAVVSGAGDENRLATSLDAGETWEVDEEETAYTGLRVTQGTGIAWGDNTLVKTRDNFGSTVELIGDWGNAIGAIGMFRVAKGIF